MKQVNLYEGKERKTFFKDEEERNLWVRLNAERIRHFQKTVNNQDQPDLGSIEIPYSHLWVSNNQLTYDEYMNTKPRFTLEELAAMNHDDLLVLGEERSRETIKKIFDEVFDDEDIITDL